MSALAIVGCVLGGVVLGVAGCIALFCWLWGR